MLFYLWPVGEMVNTVPSQGIIHGFKSRTGHQGISLVVILVFFIKVVFNFMTDKVKKCDIIEIAKSKL